MILAAGKADRFGTEKLIQKLPNGTPMIRHIAEIVLETALSPVVVVTPKDDRILRETLSGLDVLFAANPNSQLGISSSLQTGILNVPGDCEACMVVLGDQPFISNDLLLLLAEEYSHSQAEIVYPAVKGKRSNPVLLDRIVFSSLMELQGDIGARVIFQKFNNHVVDWPDSRLLLDLDTPEDLQRIIDEWEIRNQDIS